MTAQFLKLGDCIGVMAPSSYVEKSDIEKSCAALEKLGYDVFVHEQTYAKEHQSAGTTQEKIDALHELYVRENVDAIWAAGGGNRAMDIAKNAKPLLGFSDVTALLNPIFAHTGIQGFHAQSFKHLHDFKALDETLSVLSGDISSMSLADADVVQKGQAEGVLIGGCLSLFHYLPGTNDCPNLQDAILILEDTGDEISRFDRMFIHMKRMGVFEQIGGLVLGEFHNVGDSGMPFGFDVVDIISNALDGRDIPAVVNAPFGHGKNLFPLPIGANAKLDTDAQTLDF
ncbi:MAG: LD-carboxypeptidase [Pseudomonadota bacterium]